MKNKELNLQSLKFHEHPGEGGPYHKAQKSWENKSQPHQAHSVPTIPRLLARQKQWLRDYSFFQAQGTVISEQPWQNISNLFLQTNFSNNTFVLYLTTKVVNVRIHQKARTPKSIYSENMMAQVK